MKIPLIFATLVVLAVFLSGCEIYETLYSAPEPVGEVVEVSEEEINIENITMIGEIGEEIEVEETGVEEETPESLEEPATVIIVEETELISLVPKAEDPDKDKLEFIFSSPLDEEGKWKTDYGDSGEYTITVTVSDGELTSSKDVLIIVNKKEERPTIDTFNPKETAITVDETDTVEFSVEASDLNNDDLEYAWKLDGVEISDEKSLSYETTYEDAGSHTVKVTVSDSTLEADHLWSFTVNNVNRVPALEELSDISVEETETVTIDPEIFDPDDDEVTFTISDPVGDDGVWETGFDDSGEYIVTITATDGTDEVSQQVKIVVENKNRKPQILEIVQK